MLVLQMVQHLCAMSGAMLMDVWVLADVVLVGGGVDGCG